MKYCHYLFAIIAYTTLLSCGTNKKDKYTLTTVAGKGEKERFKERTQMEEQEHADSLQLEKILQHALKTAHKHFGKTKFTEEYGKFVDGLPVRVEINMDYHFSKDEPHLIIRRAEPSSLYIDIYSKGLRKFEKAKSLVEWSMTYVNDTIRDINGDGLKDFVVNTYGSNGCCLKAFSKVYLLKQDKKAFSEEFEFINPTFSPEEKIIRGVCYGHPGETDMYKYRWNAYQVDTLEYVSYETNAEGIKTGKIITSTKRPFNNNSKTLKILNAVPAEYKKIEGYDWFTGDL